jgi:serine/threonine protein kinase
MGQPASSDEPHADSRFAVAAGDEPESSDGRARPVEAMEEFLGFHPLGEPARLVAERGDGRSPAPVTPGSPPWPFDLDGYELLDELGSGGMGVVYLARQLRLNRLVALKVLRGGPDARREDLVRFLAEAEAVARLRHPHIVQIYETNQHEGRPYVVLEYVDGGGLHQRLRGMPLPPADAAALIERVARAVHVAHQHGIVHRDLKPGNILLRRKSEVRNPKSEGKGKPEIGNAVPGAAAVSDLGYSGLRLPSEFGFRSSDFDPLITDFGLAKRLGVPTA